MNKKDNLIAFLENRKRIMIEWLEKNANENEREKAYTRGCRDEIIITLNYLEYL